MILVGIITTVACATATASVADAATLSTTQAQWNLAGLAYMQYSGIDGANGPITANAATNFQTDQCLEPDGIIGSNTSDRLIAVMKQVQAKVGATQDGLNGPTTKAKIIAYQQANGLTADGLAGPATFTKMGLTRIASCGTTSTGTGIVGDIYSPSTSVACATGTTNLGTNTAYAQGAAMSVRLCAIPGFKSSSSESTSGSAYYVSGANGNVIVNSRVSGAVLAMYNKAKTAGLTLSANSSFRTMAHQQALCNADSLCKAGTYTYVARPGYSNHQLAVAIDFNGTSVKKSNANCTTNRATDAGSTVWTWLKNNAATYGYRQYAAESWHWDPMVSSSRC